MDAEQRILFGFRGQVTKNGQLVSKSEIYRKRKKWYQNKYGKDYEKKHNLPVYLGMLITWFFILFGMVADGIIYLADFITGS
ncbi:MAG: hypothetical protein K2K74_15125 [Lachnospiraceae bacterium]|nr:hypothetical protein [Lachnospiraceae bacterium]